jgi:hypothetical protein
MRPGCMASVPACWSAKSMTSPSLIARCVMIVLCHSAAQPSLSTFVIAWGAK